MQLFDSSTLKVNEYIPFNNIVSQWSSNDSDDPIIYDESSRHFLIPHASLNDYYIFWQITLKTLTQNEYPIIGLEFEYNSRIRCDTIIGPKKTLQMENSSLYRISSAISSTDILTIGLKVLGEDNGSYYLSTDSSSPIVANIIILGL